MDSIWTRKFWKDAVERVLFTAAQAALGVLVASGIIAFTAPATLAVIGTAAAAALLKAIIAALATKSDETLSPASFVKE